MTEKTYKFNMKGMDSSEESDEDVERAPAESGQDKEPVKEEPIKSSTRKSQYEKLVIHNRNAMRKTVSVASVFD